MNSVITDDSARHLYSWVGVGVGFGVHEDGCDWPAVDCQIARQKPEGTCRLQKNSATRFLVGRRSNHSIEDSSSKKYPRTRHAG